MQKEKTSQEESPLNSQASKVRGVNLEEDNFELDGLLAGLKHIGGQASSIGEAREMFQEIRRLRKSQNENERPLVFLGYTSNMISCGLREIIRMMCQEKIVDAIVTTGGGVEEDFMKCMADTYVNYDYTVNDRQWRVEGKNRIGNMIMPNDNYTMWDTWFTDHYDAMVQDQKKNGTIYTPSSMIKMLGEKIDNESSVYYWCAKNGIDVFSPGVTDGSLGDLLYCKGFSDDGFILDINADLQKIMSLARKNNHRPLYAMIFGGGICKYHILNACKMGGGLDAGIFVYVGNEFDNSCSGARPQQDVTRGAIKPNAKIIPVNYDASIAVPLIIANNN